MGNSEVGHLNLGCGRPVLQDLPRIDAAIADGSFFRNPVLLEAAARAAQPGKRLHVITLVGPGGVHANDRHAVAVATLARDSGVREVLVHAVLDGRDTPPRSAATFLPDLEDRLRKAHPGARVATIGGRYFAMDRDARWERTAAAYRAIVHGEGLLAPSVTAGLAAAYARGENDEFVQPTVIDASAGIVQDGDAVIMANFRADRARQLTHALVDGSGFPGFERGATPRGSLVATMTAYEEGLPVRVCFPPAVVRSLAEAFSERGWRQLHLAETEKYAHVTYFLNGGVEDAWPGEDRILVPSPRVATYDLCPEMSAAGITDALTDGIASDAYDFLVANYANPDMVGHTGVWGAAVRAVETVDACLARIDDAVRAADESSRARGSGGALLCVTADHGNADEMRDASGSPITAHSLNPVPILLAGSRVAGLKLRDGVLADVAPTLLALQGIPPWPGMTGRSLLEASAAPRG
jgi:2,3-bisphosphoglycerate-independent phosphoglycerate mutase